MRFLKDEKVRKSLFTGTCLICIYFIIYHIRYIWDAAGKLMDILVPFIVAAAIAFVLNVPMRWIEKGILRNREKFSGEKWDGLRRALALIITLLFTIVIISLLIYMVVPQLAVSIGQLIKQIPAGISRICVGYDVIGLTDAVVTQPDAGYGAVIDLNGFHGRIVLDLAAAFQKEPDQRIR